MRSPVIPSTAVGPAVHGLVIGVGHYENGNLAGLDGAAKSALAFATWLRDTQADGFARGSIDFSPRSRGSRDWQGRRSPPPQPSSEATMLARARRSVARRGSCSSSISAVHGIEMGDLRAVAQEVDPRRPSTLFATRAFDDFVDGMDMRPRKQVYVMTPAPLPPLWSVDDNVSWEKPMMSTNLKAAKLGHGPTRHGRGVNDAEAGRARTADGTDALMRCRGSAATIDSQPARRVVGEHAAPSPTSWVHALAVPHDRAGHRPKHAWAMATSISIPGASPVVPVLVCAGALDNTGDQFVRCRRRSAKYHTPEQAVAGALQWWIEFRHDNDSI